MRRSHLHPASLRVAHERRRRVEPHRLRVQERAQKLCRVVATQPRRLVREQRERRSVRLREPEAREADELVVDRVCRLLVDPVSVTAVDEARPERLDRLLAALAAHRAAQSFRLADREAGGRHRNVEHLVLEDDDAERVAKRLTQRLVLDRRLEARIVALRLPVLDVRVHRLPLDRPRADERHLHRQVVEVLGPRLQQALHLRAALDLEDTDGVGLLDLGEDGWIRQRDPRQVDRLAVQPRDPVDRVLDGGEHAEPEQVDLQEAGVAAAVLVPLADLPAGHRRRLHGDEVDQRTRRDDHPARVLAEVARQPGDLVRQLAEGVPARPRVRARHAVELFADPGCVPAVGDACEPLELREREPERLPDIADRSAGAIRGEARDERRMLPAVALGDADDQLLADLAREVEVDVGDGDHLVVDEPPEREAGFDGIDVREAREVADDRADARTAAAARRQRMARAARPAHLERALARELEHLPVEQEEPGEAEPRDQRQLVVEPFARASLEPVGVRVALDEPRLADQLELAVRGDPRSEKSG